MKNPYLSLVVLGLGLGCCPPVQAQQSDANRRVAITEQPAASVSANGQFSSGSSTAIKRIYGEVRGPDGPLAGAVVQLNGTTNMGVTSAAGKFELEVPANLKTMVLICQYVGFADETVRIKPGQKNTVILLWRAVQPVSNQPAVEAGWW